MGPTLKVGEDDTYNTYIGGTVSCMISILMSAYLYSLFFTMITHGADIIGYTYPDISTLSYGDVSYKKMDLMVFIEIMRPMSHTKAHHDMHKHDDESSLVGPAAVYDDEFRTHFELVWEQIEINTNAKKMHDKVKFKRFPVKQCDAKDFGDHSKNKEVYETFKD